MTEVADMDQKDAINSPEFVEFQNHIDSLMEKGRVPSLSIAVTRHDGLVYSRSFGYADLSSRKLATLETQYLWFSMSKVVTATAVLKLADEGLIDLDAPISEYIPSYVSKKGNSQPSVGQLLNHTAGVANPIPIRWVHPAKDSSFDSRKFLERRLERSGKPKYPIGQKARYSNLGYLILAEIVSQASKVKFEDYVRNQILCPIGIVNTNYVYSEHRDRAVGYVRVPRIVAPVLKAFLPRGIVGGRHGEFQALQPFLVNGAGYGGLVGDVVEAARFAALHLCDGMWDGKQILNPATVRSMRQIQTPGKPFNFGLAWFRKSMNEDIEYVEHYGGGVGFSNVMRLYPGLDQGIVLMANTTAAYDFDTLFKLLSQVPWAQH